MALPLLSHLPAFDYILHPVCAALRIMKAKKRKKNWKPENEKQGGFYEILYKSNLHIAEVIEGEERHLLGSETVISQNRLDESVEMFAAIFSCQHLPFLSRFPSPLFRSPYYPFSTFSRAAF